MVEINVKKLTDHKTKSILSYLYIELEIVRYKIALLKKYNIHRFEFCICLEIKY